MRVWEATSSSSLASSPGQEEEVQYSQDIGPVAHQGALPSTVVHLLRVLVRFDLFRGTEPVYPGVVVVEGEDAVSTVCVSPSIFSDSDVSVCRLLPTLC